jgi:hypothetical protein
MMSTPKERLGAYGSKHEGWGSRGAIIRSAQLRSPRLTSFVMRRWPDFVLSDNATYQDFDSRIEWHTPSRRAKG